LARVLKKHGFTTIHCKMQVTPPNPTLLAEGDTAPIAISPLIELSNTDRDEENEVRRKHL
jgi:hypothetical protein